MYYMTQVYLFVLLEDIFLVGHPVDYKPACPYKHTIIFTMKLTTQRDLAKWASPASI